jgi:1-deoxy-D-xylulose-5-phosphate synthase
MPEWETPLEEIPIGVGRKISDGEEVAILSIGHPGNFVQDACLILKEEELFPAHFDMRFVKPLDEELLHEVFQKFEKIVTVEDGCLMGGFGSAILEFMADHNYKAKVIRLGIPDHIVEHGEQSELHKECGYDSAAIAASVRSLSDIVLNQ